MGWSGGTFTLLNDFDTGTAPDNMFPPAVGIDLRDIADGISIPNLVPAGSLMQFNVSVTTTVGFLFTSFDAGTFSSGTYTPAAANGNYQFLTNNGAFTWAVPAADSAIDVLVTNGGSAGAITFSGYTVASGNTGDPLDTTNTHKFIVSVRRINSVSTYVIKGLQ